MSAREIQRSLRALVGGGQGYKPLSTLPVVGAQPGGVSVGHPGSAAESVSLTETDYLQREYWPVVTRATSDGLFTWQELPIKSVLLEGGNRFNFKQPVDPAP